MPPIRAVPASLFPTLENSKEVIELAVSKLPVNQRNDMISLLMIMRNTTIKEIHDGT